jgi:maleylpyruvate isomerase
VELEPGDAIPLCVAAHGRLAVTCGSLDDGMVRRPSRLPGWSVGHVLTHLARNAEGHVRRLEGSLRGEEVPRYPGGQEQRRSDIEQGAGRGADEIAADLRDWSARLEATWERCAAAGWPHAELRAGDAFPTTGSPARRLREVEVHHADLGLSYGPGDWPDEYVAWELEISLPRLPRRFREPGDARRFLAWLTGRADLPTDLSLTPWL